MLLRGSLDKSFLRKQGCSLSGIIGSMGFRFCGDEGLDQPIPGYKSCTAVTGYNVIRMLVLFLVLVSAGDAYCATEKSKIQYIESAGLSFEQLVEKISQQTGYQIELVGEWPDIPVQISLQGISLEDGLHRIIKQMGNISHILIFDSEEKKLKIVSLKAGTAPDRTVSVVPDMVVDEDNINPTPGSAEHGMTQGELAAIKAEYRENIRNQAGETELLPSGEYGPALTQAEFDLIQEEYHLTMESGGADYVLPPSANDEGLTASDLESIKKSYHQQRDAEGSAAQVLPASEYGPGLTEGELEAIKAAHGLKPVSTDTVVSPPSSQGPGVTLGELEEIKRAYRERQESGLSAD